MPYVEGFGTWPFGEEWLWEAVASVYLPLLDVLDGAPVTLGLTPVLCDQLEASAAAGERFLRFLRDIRAPIHAEDSDGLERTGEPELAAEVRRAAGDYERREAFERRRRDLLGAFAALRTVELWTSAATHAVLPLLATDAGLRLQLAPGSQSHERRFGGVERRLLAARVRLRAGARARPRRPRRARVLRRPDRAWGPASITWSRWPPRRARWPCRSTGQTVELVWGQRGYPSHGSYRDYHRRTVHDLKPWNNAGDPYDHDAALALAREHARDFVERAAARVAERRALLCCALDTELLGHWWYEGPAWLAAVLEEAAAPGLALVTVREGLERAEPVERDLAASTWGTARTCRPGTRRGWRGGAAARAGRAANRRGGHRRRTRARARRSSARPRAARAAVERLGVHVTRELAGDYPEGAQTPHAGPGRRARRLCRLRRRAGPRAVRNLAPDLDLASLTAAVMRDAR